MDPHRTTSKLSRLQEYLAVADLPDITDVETKELDDLGSTVHHRNFVSVRTSMQANSPAYLDLHSASGSTPIVGSDVSLEPNLSCSLHE